MSIFLLTPTEAFANKRCRAPLGKLNQNDPAILNDWESAVHRSKTMLCGPTCFVNALNRLRATAGWWPLNLLNELLFIADSIPQAIGLPKEKLREDGMFTYELLRTMEWYSRNYGPPMSAKIRGIELSPESLKEDGVALRKNIRLKDLVVKPNEVTFVNFETWNSSNINDLFPNSEGYVGGHYVLLSRVYPENAKGEIAVEFNDPTLGRVNAKLTRVRPAKFGIDTFQLNANSKSKKPSMVLVTNIIKLKNQKY